VRDAVDGLLAVAGQADDVSGLGQHDLGKALVDEIVLGDEDPQAARRAGSQRDRGAGGNAAFRLRRSRPPRPRCW
jgi:hypothetical protein